MSRVNGHRARGFSLIEIVTASTLLSLGVVTICTLSVRNVKRIHDNQQEEMAWDVLDRQLTMIDYVGVDEFLQMGRFEGTLGGEDSPMGEYQWKAAVEAGSYTGSYNVAMVISWGPESHPQQISAMTILMGTAATQEEESQEEDCLLYTSPSPRD